MAAGSVSCWAAPRCRNHPFPLDHVRVSCPMEGGGGSGGSAHDFTGNTIAMKMEKAPSSLAAPRLNVGHTSRLRS